LSREDHGNYYEHLCNHYGQVRPFLPRLLREIHFEGNRAGQSILEALEFLKRLEDSPQVTIQDVPREVLSRGWRQLVEQPDGSLDRKFYTFCVLERLHDGLHRRDIFLTPSERWADPRTKLLLVHPEVPALTSARLAWVQQNYIRAETLIRANARLVKAQSDIPLTKEWGGGEVASADGLRFVVPVRTLHAGYNSKYFHVERGVTYYNFTSNQFSGFHGIVIPGTLHDSPYVLDGLLEHPTELQPRQLMTDSAGRSRLLIGVFRFGGGESDNAGHRLHCNQRKKVIRLI
jgi:Tn3 transposase DDE domain